MFRNFLKNEKGGAMLMAIMGLAIISVFTLAAMFMGSSNARQTQTEGKRTQAYYVADAGAKSFVKHLEGLPAKKIKEELKEMSEKPRDEITGTYEDWDFTINVDKELDENDVVKENEYKIESKATVDGTTDGTVAILSLEEKGGSGYNIGDGKIFLNKEDGDNNTQIPLIPQLKGNGVSIHTGMSKYGSKVPIHINDGKSNELFKSISDRVKSGDIKALNEQVREADTGGKYSLIIDDRTEGNISSTNKIKSERLVRQGGKSEEFKDMEFNYELQKEDIVNYFSYKKLPSKDLKDSELDEAIENIFMLPIKDKAEYDKYMSKAHTKLFPKIEVPDIKGKSDGSKEMDIKYPVGNKDQVIDLRAYEVAQLNKKLDIEEKGELTIKTRPNAILLLESIEMSKGGELIIDADETLDIYVSGDAQPDGDIIVKKESEGRGQVNLYMTNGKTFQTNNEANILGMNLYNPEGEVHLNNDIVFEGVIICKHIQFKDTATFRAPSKGSSSSNMNDEWGLGSIEWRNWKE